MSLFDLLHIWYISVLILKEWWFYVLWRKQMALTSFRYLNRCIQVFITLCKSLLWRDIWFNSNRWSLVWSQGKGIHHLQIHLLGHILLIALFLLINYVVSVGCYWEQVYSIPLWRRCYCCGLVVVCRGWSYQFCSSGAYFISHCLRIFSCLTF